MERNSYSKRTFSKTTHKLINNMVKFTYNLRRTLATILVVGASLQSITALAETYGIGSTTIKALADETTRSALLDSLHQQCVDDTTDTKRQKWYNREDFTTAFNAYDKACADPSETESAISALQEAHDTYTAIKTAYRSLLDESKALKNDVGKAKFVLRDSIGRAWNKIFSYYYVDKTDHYSWVCETLPWIRSASSAFDAFKKLNKTLSEVRNQYKATDYDGKETLAQAMSEAFKTLITEGDETTLTSGSSRLKEALAAYLKNRPSEWVTIQNGLSWKTKTGSTVQAHAPGFVRVGDLWYMVGEDRSNTWHPDVNLYSSTDLVHWTFEKKIIENGVATSELGSSRMIERPKLMYNASTDKYVVWCHYESSNYSASEAACFECDSVNGAYTYVWSGRPLDVKSRDCNVFQDTDGTAYFISTTEENQHLGLFRLDEDYHTATEHTQLFSWQSREAPAIVKVGSRYFMFNSACSGWEPNQCKMSYTNNLKSGWSSLQNIGNSNAFDTQAAAILVVEGTKKTTYLYVGDRWYDPELGNTKTIIFPIEFNGTSCNFTYRERFDLNFKTGEWRETPTENYFADRSGWTVTECSSEETSSEKSYASNIIDGKTSTIWHTRYSGTAASAPHSVTVDMGKERVIKGFLSTPRMDGSTNGLIRDYTFETSLDGETWTTASAGSWLPYCTVVSFDSQKCRYIRLTSNDGSYASMAELNVIIDYETETSIDSPNADENRRSTISGITYYTLSGIPTSSMTKGLVVEKTVYADGSTKAIKKLIR